MGRAPSKSPLPRYVRLPEDGNKVNKALDAIAKADAQSLAIRKRYARIKNDSRALYRFLDKIKFFVLYCFSRKYRINHKFEKALKEQESQDRLLLEEFDKQLTESNHYV